MKNKKHFQISGKVVDVFERKIFPGVITIDDGIISSIKPANEADDVFILPGLIDSHIHIESSMITPGAFALTAVRHGTIACVSDPHEIANVMGIDGVKFMIKDSGKVPMKFFFGAPSCVPATGFETSGAVLRVEETKALMAMPEIKYLSEMMNYPGVVFNDDEVHEKILSALNAGKPVDGHAPGLTGEMLKKYAAAGITTDHECSTIEEAREKIELGMKIIIREGSAARNLGSLKDLYKTHPEMVMLCSDDLHPEMLQVRHINKVIGGLAEEGYDIFDVLRSATLNPNQHYKLNTGLLRVGDPADIIVVDDLKKMNVLETWIDGEKVFDRGNILFKYDAGKAVNKFNCSRISSNEIRVFVKSPRIKVIKAIEGELLTGEILWEHGQEDFINPDITGDYLKIVVKDRYNDAPPSVAFINGFGLGKGAFAGSIAHDSHNIICVGTNDDDIVAAINKIVDLKGGLAVSVNGTTESLQLNIAGIMSTRSCDEVASEYQHLSELVRYLGCPMNAPFMTLSFMALLVIPDLKISDRGLFDVRQFRLVPLFT